MGERKVIKGAIDPILVVVMVVSLTIGMVFEIYCYKKGLPRSGIPFSYDLFDLLFPWTMDQDRAIFVREILAGNLGPLPYMATTGQTKEDMYAEIIVNKIMDELLEESVDEVAFDVLGFLDSRDETIIHE